jgi:very-short-patch-repair endonuclease
MRAAILARVADAYDFERPIHVESHERADVVVGRLAERPDLVIARLAERQHGVVARRQLLAARLTREAIAHRIRVGRLHSLYRGVYAAGHRLLSPEARWMAAVLAAGPRGVLSHRSAAALWRIRPWRGSNVDVTLPSSRRQRPGITWHVTNLPADEVTSLAAIPLTTVPRTLLDLAAVLDHRGVERAINEAQVQRYTDPLSLPALLARYPRRRGTATIRAILAAGDVGTSLTRSELEERFLRFVAQRGLPRPQLNVPIAVRGRFVEGDCVWRGARVIAELDGRGVHGTTAAFERDRARDRALNAAGWRVVRITWRQLSREQQELEQDIRALLGARQSVNPGADERQAS